MPYEVGDRVIVNLQRLVILQFPDHGEKTEAIGTVVNRPGGALYNVHLDEPLAPGVDMLTFVGGGRLKPVL